jgi:uncharacterized protein YfiM (DUF2279 family)
MTRKSRKLARSSAWLTASLTAAFAMLAFASPASAHHHGRHHHRHHRFHRDFHGQDGAAAGQIASFDAGTGMLTITLTNGNTVSGLVTDETSIECGGGCDHHDWTPDDRRQLHSWDGGGWDDSSCSTASLVPGAVVQGAILVIANGDATFARIDLAPPASGPLASD